MSGATEKEAVKEQGEAHKALLDHLQELLKDHVKQVKLSNRLKNHAVCLSSDGPLSIEMEKVLNSMPTDNKVKAERVLEINADHPVFQKLISLYENENEQQLKTYADVLYTQAQMIEGILPDDPAAYAESVWKLLA